MLAIGVMMYHLLGSEYGIDLATVGTYGTYTFFVLSGFAMAWVYADSPVNGFPSRDFSVARMARILPLWWLATLATIVVALPHWRRSSLLCRTGRGSGA